MAATDITEAEEDITDPVHLQQIQSTEAGLIPVFTTVQIHVPEVTADVPMLIVEDLLRCGVQIDQIPRREVVV